MEDYGGTDGKKTFVAFVDISGFKKLMNKGKGGEALDTFYSAGYNELINYQNQIDGIFVSDCGVLFARNDKSDSNDFELLENLLSIIKELNKTMLRDEIMLTTSIAYGLFKYEKRIILKNMEKGLFLGGAYLAAYQDCNGAKPKISPGQCRIVKSNLPPEIREKIDESNQVDEILKMIKIRKGDKEHYYFYWMRREPNEIDEFEEKVPDAPYIGMLSILKGNRSIS